jgi:LacI family transcriptional regulator
VPDRERKRPSMRDVADRAGVAISSVSRVLSGDPDVSPVMRNRVEDAVAALGYERDLIAQSMRSGKTMSIGFVAIDVANPIIAANSAGAVAELRNAGYSLLMSNSRGDPELDAEAIRLFKLRRVDGLLLSLADERAPRTLEALRAFDGPIVLIDRSLPPDIRAGAVLHDHAAGMVPAARHLLELGHRRLALINGAPRVRPARERAKAVRRALKSYPDADLVVQAESYTAEHGYAATRAVFENYEPPTAVIVGGNQILQGVMGALRDLSLVIPDDISLVTLDDVPLAEFLQPSLSRVTRDPVEVGHQAATLLLEQIRGAEPRIVSAPTRFISGGSCGPPARQRPRAAAGA